MEVVVVVVGAVVVVLVGMAVDCLVVSWETISLISSMTLSIMLLCSSEGGALVSSSQMSL